MAPKLRRRKGELSDKLEGGCAKACGKYCRMTPMTQALCCTVVVLGITGAVIWLGGSVLGAGNGGAACGGQTAPTSGKSDVSASVNVFLLNTGIVVMLMLIASCICCIGFVGLCCGELPSTAKVVGAVCLLVAAVAACLYGAWITYGIIALRSEPDCINAIVYLALLIFYFIVFLTACMVGVVWKLHDIRTGGKQSFKVSLPA